MVNDDGVGDSDVERVQEREVARGGYRERDEGSGDHDQLALWVIEKCFVSVNGVYGMYYTSRVGLRYDGNLFPSR